MKKGIIVLLLFITSTGIAQTGLGIKGGLNYGDNGDVTFSDIANAGEDGVRGGDSKVGYHAGLYYRAEFSNFFLKPELVYTKTSSSYDYNNESADYDVSKLDLPILVGIDILGPINVFAGPSLQYILDNEFQGVTLGDVENEFSIGAQFGAGVQFGGVGVDVRYERGLKDNEAKVIENSTGLQKVDSRPNQIIFSLSLKL